MELGEQAAELLIQVLKPVGGVVFEGVRKMAVYTLVRIGEQAVGSLIQALENEDWVVRFSAADALGKIGDARAVEPLSRALKDENSIVRTNAAWALGGLGETRVVEPLVRALRVGHIGDAKGGEPPTRLLIVHSIRSGHADVTAAGPFTQALNYRGWYVRIRSAEALGKIGDARAIEPLKEALKDENSDVQKAANPVSSQRTSM